MHPLAATVLRYGLPLVFVNVFLEQMGLPIPAVPTLIVAGALSVGNDPPAARVLAVAVVACLIADSIWFALGRRHGLKILKTLCRVSLSPDSCVRQTATAFERYGMPSLLVAKFIPGFSTVAPPLAGAIARRTGSFLLYDGFGSILWAGGAILVGRLFHSAIDRALGYLASIGTSALAVLAFLLVLFVAAKWFQRRRFYRMLRMARITAEELDALRRKGQEPVVLDVRSASTRAANPRRIPGARYLDLSDVEAKASGLPSDREIVLYCT